MYLLKDKNTLKKAFKQMYTIKELDTKIHEDAKSKSHQMMGPMHSHVGAEAYSVATILHLNSNDYISTTYRNHAHAIARDADLNALVSEFHGKETGICNGIAGNMHCVDQNANIIAAFGIIGAGLPAACGAAFASKYNNDKDISCVFFGDGAVAQGAFHESLNIASVMDLPVLFINDNNSYAMSTHIRNNLVSESTLGYAQAYDMPCISIDGLNFFEVYDAVKKATEYIRSTGSPYYIECKTYRYHGQWEWEDQKYKPNDERDYFETKDPVKHFERTVLELELLTKIELKTIKSDVKQEVKNAFDFAINSNYPKLSAMYDNIYADKY